MATDEPFRSRQWDVIREYGRPGEVEHKSWQA
jgi:hypothetical protein